MGAAAVALLVTALAVLLAANNGAARAQTGTATVYPSASPTGTATSTSTATATATAATPAATTATATATSTGTATTPIAGGQTITLSGAEENPPVTTSATGTFQFRLDGQTLSWRLQVNGNGETLTAAHLHMGARGANGPVVVPLFTGNTANADVAGQVTAGSLAGPLAGNLQGFLDALKAGTLYANVHSVSQPGGVVRAQLPGTPAPSAPATGTGVESSDGGATAWMFATLAGAGALALTGGAAAVALRRRP